MGPFRALQARKASALREPSEARIRIWLQFLPHVLAAGHCVLSSTQRTVSQALAINQHIYLEGKGAFNWSFAVTFAKSLMPSTALVHYFRSPIKSVRHIPIIIIHHLTVPAFSYTSPHPFDFKSQISTIISSHACAFHAMWQKCALPEHCSLRDSTSPHD